MTVNEASFSKTENERIYWLDVARVFAIIAITCNHANSMTFDMHVDPALEFSTIPLVFSVFKAFMHILSRIGVPIFLMITGALLLKRDYTQKIVLERFYRHNWLSLLTTAEIWYFIIFAYKSLGANSILRNDGLVAALKQAVCNQLFINQDTFGNMWYLPMILCVYLIIPFIAVGVQHFNTKGVLIPTILIFISSFFVHDINSLIYLTVEEPEKSYIRFELSSGNLCSMYVIFVIAGYWISNDGIKWLNGILLVALLLLSFLVTSSLQLWAISRPVNCFVTYKSTGVLVISLLLFEVIRRYGHKLTRIAKPVTFISKISFGIFFVHMCIMIGIKALIPRHSHYLVHFLILELGSFIGSVVIILLLKRFKRLSRLLFRL